MKIVVKVTIEMTPEQLAGLQCEYGFGSADMPPSAEVREFVKSYIRENSQQSPAAAFWTATVAD